MKERKTEVVLEHEKCFPFKLLKHILLILRFILVAPRWSVPELFLYVSYLMSYLILPSRITEALALNMEDAFVI